MLDLGNLKIGITVESDNAKSQLNDLSGAVEGTGSKLATFGKIAGGAAVAAGVAVAGFCTKAVGDYMEVADAIDKGSQKLGISSDAYQEWGYVFERNGASIDSFGRSMKTMQKNVLDGAEAFTTIGVATMDAEGHFRSQEEVMNDTILALAGMNDETERNALAQEIFGNQYTELLPLLNQGTDALEGQKNAAHELGLVIDGEAITAGAALGDTMADIKDSIGMVVTNIAIQLMPVIQTVCDFIIAHMPEIQAAIQLVIDVVSSIVGVIATVVSAVISVIPQVTSVIDTIWTTITGLVDKVMGIGQSFYNAGKNAINNLLSGFRSAWNAVSSWVNEKVAWVKSAFSGLGGWISGLAGSHRTGLREVPYDGYIAELHKGEMVLTAPEANQYQKSASGTTSVNNITVNNYSPKALTEAETARQFRKTQRKLQLGF